jgi:hypothetical protein
MSPTAASRAQLASVADGDLLSLMLALLMGGFVLIIIMIIILAPAGHLRWRTSTPLNDAS